MASRPTEHFKNRSCWLGTHGRVHIQLFEGEITRAEIDAAYAVTEKLLAAYPEGVVTVAVISAGALPRLSDDARRRAEVVTKQLAGKIRANVQVVEGDGFAGASIRAILSGLNLFNPARGRIFASVRDAAAWIGTQRELALEADEIVAVVESGRAAWRR